MNTTTNHCQLIEYKNDTGCPTGMVIIDNEICLDSCGSELQLDAATNHCICHDSCDSCVFDLLTGEGFCLRCKNLSGLNKIYKGKCL
jgi:hypothetical protein